MNDLIIVSNRGPFNFSSDFFSYVEKFMQHGGTPRDIKFGEGGLVQAMSGLLKSQKWKTTWLGASMGDRDIDVARGHYTPLFKRMEKEKYAPGYFPLIEIGPDRRMHFQYKDYDFFMRFVFFDTRHMSSYYSKFANGFLWPLMHLTRSPLFYKRSRVFPRPSFSKNDFIQYTSSGVTFANTIMDEILKSEKIENNDKIIIWNQDYHLMRIADVFETLLQEEGISENRKRKVRVGQFIHTPFFDIHEIQGLIREDKRNRIRFDACDPFSESIEGALQKLTWGMLANDFIGFHTKEYCDHYLEALEEWFPVEIKVNGEFYEIRYQNRTTKVGAFPIGLDVDHILAEVTPGKELEYTVNGEDLYEKILGDKDGGIIVFGGLERCDYTKGLLERIQIFHHTLGRIRGSGKRARFYQVTAPSRTENIEYQKLQASLVQEVSRANQKVQDDAIVLLDEGIPAPQNYRFMKDIDAMFVTPLEDGMNLVAFEYILSQKYKHPKSRGFLILSTSGASRVLREKGFADEDGIIHIDPMRPKKAAEKICDAVTADRHISENVIAYVEKDRRVDDWADRNVEAISRCRE
jgi:trehalose-6-phosphate synthase